jgi:hypothetical protein
MIFRPPPARPGPSVFRPPFTLGVELLHHFPVVVRDSR